MHKILGPAGKNFINLGQKGTNLIKLDAAGVTPDFLIISAPVLHKALGAHITPGCRARPLSRKLAPSLLKEITTRLSALNIKKAMVRSSSLAEDSQELSCAGVFSSYPASGPAAIEPLIRAVWASGFSSDFLKYSKTPPERLPGMAVIIQRFARPDYSGTVLADLSGKKGVYVEYRRGVTAKDNGGAVKDYVFFEKDGISCFNDNEVEIEHSCWLMKLTAQVLSLKKTFGQGFLQVEFSISSGRIFLVQARTARAGADISNSLFKFENECRYNYHYSDFSDKEAGALFGAVGLTSQVRSEITEEGLFLRYHILTAIEDEIRKKSRTFKFAAAFEKTFLDFILDEARKTKTLKGKSALQLFSGLKELNFKLSLFNYLYTRLMKFSSDLPHPPARTGHSELLRRIVALKNSANSRFSVITQTYYGRIALFTGEQDGRRIAALCRTSRENIASVLSGKATPEKSGGPRKKPRDASPRARRRLHAAFPLQGVAAQGGNISGIVKIAGENTPPESVTGRHILVADYLSSFFLPHMLLCRGIITAKGGLNSHAATIARELRKPCLINVPGCGSILKDGDRVKIKDARVYRLPV